MAKLVFQKKLLVTLLLIVGFFVIMSAVYAAPAVVTLPNPIGPQQVDTAVLLDKAGVILKAFIGFCGAVAMLMFVYGGFLWLTSGGSPDKIKKGRDVFTWSIIGLVIIFNSYLLVDFVLARLSGSSAANQQCYDQVKAEAVTCYTENPKAGEAGQSDPCYDALVTAREQCRKGK